MNANESTIEAMRGAAGAMRSPVSSVHDEVRALKQARDAIDSAIASRLAEMEAARAHELENASSLTTWARRELRMEAAETHTYLRAARAARDLPELAVAFGAGRTSLKHANLAAFSIKHVGLEPTRQIESPLVESAQAHAPGRIKRLIDRLRASVHPEQLDKAWIDGMAKADFNLHKTFEGWHVTGFLPIETGAKFKAVLESLSVPRASADDRTAAQRRVEGLDALLTDVLARGLPTDGTVAPQIHVFVDAGTLQQALAPATESAFEPADPATLVGFGHIGPMLLRHLTEGAGLTPILVDRIEPNPRVLDVGRTRRLATTKQRHAVWVHQAGQCANDGCANSIDDLHHLTAWFAGGATSIDNLSGLCQKCHQYWHARDGTRQKVS